MSWVFEIFCALVFSVGLLGIGVGVQRSDGVLAVCGVALMIVALDWRFIHKPGHDPTRGR